MTLFELVAKLSLDSSNFEQGIGSASSKIKSFGKGVKSGLVTTAKVGAAAITAVGTATIATGAVITKATGKVAEYGDNIDKMSQKMGLSAEKYQEWDAILQHSGSSIEAMKGGMRTLANAVAKGSKEFEKLGITQDQVASMSQEELFEATIAGLQKVENTSERTYLAGKLLGRGATELGALLNTSAEDTEKMRQRVHELGGVMSDEAVKASAKYQDSLQDLQTAVEGMKRKTASDFLPSMVSIMDGLTSIFANEKGGVGKVTEGVNGIIKTVQDSVPKLASVVGAVGSALFDAVSKNIPAITKGMMDFSMKAVDGLMDAAPKLIDASFKILSTITTSILDRFKGVDVSKDLIPKVTEIFKKVVTGFSSMLPQFVGMASELFKSIGEGLDQGLPDLLSGILPMLVKFSETIRENAGTLISAGLDMIVHLAQGIANSLPVLIENIPTIITNIANIINDNAPKLLVAAGKIIIILVQGIIKALPVLIANIPKILQAIWAVFTAVNWINLGASIISKIGSGIKTVATNLPDLLRTIGEKAVNLFRSIDWANLGQSVISLIGQGLKMLITNIPNILVTIGRTAVNLFKAINWIQLGTIVINLIATGLKSIGSKIWQSLKSIGKTAVDKVKKIDWYGVGVNIVKGIVSGITAAPSLIGNALFKVAKAGYNKVTKYLETGSPSKLFRREVGANITKGMALGIEDKIPNVVSAMDNVSKKLNVPDINNMPFASIESVPATADDVLNYMGGWEVQGNVTGDERKDITVILELDKIQLAKTVFSLYGDETQRRGVKLAGGIA